MIAIADDSGLEVEALGGAPGVRSARYSGPHADDRSNNEKLLRELEGVPEGQRHARFVCCIAIADGDNIQTFEGYVRGRIGHAPRGRGGFGYDPLFYPEGHDRTFAEMTDKEKNAISHRAMALRLLGEYLKENKDRFREG
jgi:XTP/dITP diphosphohydrolase